MLFFSKSKEKPKLGLLFDLGSSSVAASLFFIRKDKGPKIIFSIRENIKLEEKINFDRFLYSTISTLDIVASKASAAGLGNPSSFFCVLSSPWYSSQIRNISLKKNNSFVFTQKLADELIKKEINLFQEENSSENNIDREVSSFEIKNMRTMLNGYISREPLNKKTKEIDMSFFVSISPTIVLNKIKSTLNKHFNQNDIKFSSFTLASFTVARDMFIHQDNFTLVNIGGENTELSLVKKEALQSSSSFPLGYNFFIRNLSLILKCSISEARSYLSIYKNGHASVSLEKRIKPILEKLKLEWLVKFQESIAFLSNDISVSPNIFMTVDEEFAQFFAETIKNEQFNQYSLTESKFRVVYLGTQMLHGIAEYEKEVDHDLFIIIESIYINNFLV